MTLPLPAVLVAHKAALGVAGAGAAVVLGMRARKKAAATPAAATPVTTAASTKGGVYDSTANDVYNSIQPQLQSQAFALNDLQAQLTAAQAAGSTPRAGAAPLHYNIAPGQTVTVWDPADATGGVPSKYQVLQGGTGGQMGTVDAQQWEIRNGVAVQVGGPK